MRAASRWHHRLWLTRAVTLGVRAIVLDDGKVFLVRHTYLPGWHFPGGAVDRGESAEGAAVRELREEGGLIAADRPSLLGFYRNGRRDHVACFVIRRFTHGPQAHTPGWEIAETGFFPVASLPEGVTAATRARLAELLDGQPASEDW